MSVVHSVPLLATSLAIVFGSGLTRAVASDPPYAGPVGLLFAEGTDEEYLGTVLADLQAQTPAGYQFGARWPGGMGTPATVTWSLVPDGVPIPSVGGEPAAPSDLFTRMDALFAAQGGRATWVALIQDSMDLWSAVSGVTLVRETSGGNDWDDGAAWGSAGAPGARGDIRIGMHSFDGVGGILAATSTPTIGGDIVFDSAESWDDVTVQHRMLRNATSYVGGFAVGLRTMCAPSHSFLMEGRSADAGTLLGPQHDDLRGIHHLYGGGLEGNDTPGSAVALGSLGFGTSLVDLGAVPLPPTGVPVVAARTTSIHTSLDVDYYSLQVPLGARVGATLTAIGFQYSEGVPALNPSVCQSQTTTNSHLAANLKLELLRADGSTLLAVSSQPFPATTESIPGTVVTDATVYLRVSADGLVARTQLYSLEIDVEQGCFSPDDCNGNSLPDECDLELGTSTDHNEDGVLDECQSLDAEPGCPGDQLDPSMTSCACGNAGAPGHGCANSIFTDGALLEITGVSQPADTLTLEASGMPATVASIFLKGDQNASAGLPFGDGIRCVDGNLIRLGTRTNVGGASSYPGPGQPAISVRGQTPIGSGLTAHYQTYYRNAAAAFCPPETFNVTNGFRVTW